MTPATLAEVGIEQVVPFFAVADIAASVEFYRDGLGFAVQHTWEPEGRLRWCLLRREGAALMLQEHTGHGHGVATPAGTVGLGVTICVMCRDALAFHREVTARGITTQEPFVGNGLWVVDLVDPDGYRLEFESPTDVPEGTRLAEWQPGG